jgi:hypothetical protein
MAEIQFQFTGKVQGSIGGNMAIVSKDPALVSLKGKTIICRIVEVNHTPGTTNDSKKGAK